MYYIFTDLTFFKRKYVGMYGFYTADLKSSEDLQFCKNSPFFLRGAASRMSSVFCS